MNTSNKHIKGKHVSVKGTWFIALTCVAVLLGTYVNVFSYAAFVLAAIAIFILSEEDSLCLLIFIMPFANIFKSSVEAQSFFTHLMIFYAFCGIFRKREMERSFAVSFFFLVLFFVFQMFDNIDILRTIKLLVHVLLIYIATGIKTNDDHKKVFLSYVLGVIISSLLAALEIIPNLENYVHMKELGNAYGGESRFAGLYPDPNYYTVNVIISLCLVIVLNHKKQIGSIALWALVIPLVVFAIMTYSKSALFMLLLPLVMLLYSKIKRKNLLVFLILAIAASILFVGVFEGKIEAFDIVLQRLGSGEDIDELTTGRASIWDTYIKHLSKIDIHTFMGAGLGAELINGHGAHNTYIDLLYYLGIVGTTIVLITLFRASKQKITPKRKTVFNYSGWLCVIPLYFFLSELFYFDWSFHILMAILINKTDMQMINKSRISF